MSLRVDSPWTIYSLDCIIVRDGLYDTSQLRDELRIVNLRAAWFQEFSLVMCGLFIIVGCWGAAFLALCGDVDSARRFLGIVLFWMNGALNSVTLGIFMGMQGGALTGVYPMVGGVCLCFFVSYFVLLLEEYLFRCHVLWISFCASLIAFLFDGFVVYPGEHCFTWEHLYGGWWSELSLIPIFSLMTSASRNSIYRDALMGIQQDVHTYTKAWEELRAADSESCLEHLSRVAAAIFSGNKMNVQQTIMRQTHSEGLLTRRDLHPHLEDPFEDICYGFNVFTHVVSRAGNISCSSRSASNSKARGNTFSLSCQ